MSLEGTNDPELDAILSDVEAGDPSDLSTQSVGKQTQADSPATIKAGGREFKDISELSKAYSHAVREISRKGQEVSAAKQWLEFADNLKKHPELQADILKRVDEYNARLNAGQSKATAKAATGVDEAMADRLNQMEAKFAEIQLEKELIELRNKYSLDRDEEREFLEVAADMTKKYGEIPLEMAYRHYAFDRSVASSKANGERSGAEGAVKKQKAFVGGSKSAGVRPSEKSPSEMNNNEFNEAMNAELSKFGLSD